jgi:hypothetical protein
VRLEVFVSMEAAGGVSRAQEKPRAEGRLLPQSCPLGGRLRTCGMRFRCFWWLVVPLLPLCCAWGGDVSGEGPSAVWPLSGSAEPDADAIRAPFGPRWIGRYNFHAGIDLPAATGAPVYSVLPGRVVQVRPWDGRTIGAGNAVLVHHEDGRSTAYLHLDEIHVKEGQELGQGDLVGTVGSTGATYPHLHLTYFEGLPGNSVDERRSRNPLELLPHRPLEEVRLVSVEGETGEIVLSLPLQNMTVQKVALVGSERTIVLDYYEIVSRGSSVRSGHVQDGVYISASGRREGRFQLTLRPEDPRFGLRRVALQDFSGRTVFDEAL